MGREVRRVPADWEHPTNESGMYIPLFKKFPYNKEEIKESLEDGWLENKPPNYGCNVMPQWSEAEKTHYQMYEFTTEGTPYSPVMETPEKLARWLSDNKMGSTYDEWLAFIIHNKSTVTAVIGSDGICNDV